MENSGMSASDVVALTKNNDGFLEGNGIIILILFFLIFGFGGNGFGNNSNGLTQAELQNGLYNQTTDRNLSDISSAICSSTAGINSNINAVNTSMLTGMAGIDKSIMENRYDNSLQTQTLSSQMASCCCENRLAIANQTNELANAVHSEGEATRALVTANRIADLEKDLQLAQIVASNQTQTQTILNSIGRFVPYNGYGYVTGCGCAYSSGTTI